MIEVNIIGTEKHSFRSPKGWAIRLVDDSAEFIDTKTAQRFLVPKAQATSSIKISSTFSTYNIIVALGTKTLKLLLPAADLSTLKNWMALQPGSSMEHLKGMIEADKRRSARESGINSGLRSIIIGAILIAAGLSGQWVLRGTHSGGLLAIVGGALVLLGIVSVAKAARRLPSK